MANSLEELNDMINEILEIFRRRVFACSENELRRTLIRSFINNPEYIQWNDQYLRYRFRSEQNNGQLVFGPRKSWTGDQPERGSEVFVSNLDGDICAPELLAIFQLVGNILFLRMMMEFSGNLRGFVYIRYDRAETANMAAEVLNGLEYRPGRHMVVRISIDNCRLFIGNIPKDQTPEQIERILRHRTENVESVISYFANDDRQSNRGFCFVNYTNHTAATIAKRSLISLGIPEWEPFPISVDWATPERPLHRSLLKKIKVVFIRNLFTKTTDLTIRIFIEQYVKRNYIVKVKKINNIAFVHFTTHQHAEFVVENLNGQFIDGSRIEVTYARPVDASSESYILQNLPDESQQHELQRNSLPMVQAPPPPLAQPRPQNPFNDFQHPQHPKIPAMNPLFVEGFLSAYRNGFVPPLNARGLTYNSQQPELSWNSRAASFEMPPRPRRIGSYSRPNREPPRMPQASPDFVPLQNQWPDFMPLQNRRLYTEEMNADQNSHQNGNLDEDECEELARLLIDFKLLYPSWQEDV